MEHNYAFFRQEWRYTAMLLMYCYGGFLSAQVITTVSTDPAQQDSIIPWPSPGYADTLYVNVPENIDLPKLKE